MNNDIIGILRVLPKKLSKYKQEDVFNVKVSGIFSIQAGNKTYVCSGEDKASGKFCAIRLTVLFCTSIRGGKTKLLFIGKALIPAALRD